MSRRGGRGGGGGGGWGRDGGGMNTGGKMRGEKLPFNVDPEIEKEVVRSIAEESADSDRELYPDIGLLTPRSPTEDEHELVRLYRVRRVKMKASPFWTGDASEQASHAGDPTLAEAFNPFENAPTYSNSKRKRTIVTPNLKNVKNIYLRFFPKEFHSVLRHEDETGRDAKRPRKLALAKQSVRDRLAKFDEDADVEAEENEADDVNSTKANDDDEDDGGAFAQLFEDDTFEADEEDDEVNDYNAEAYFDDGEADVDDYGEDDHGGGGGDDGY